MNWYYIADGNKQGPYTASQMDALIASGIVSDATPVCQDGMAGWVPASNHFSFTTDEAGTATTLPLSRSASRIAARMRVAHRARHAQTISPPVSAERQAKLKKVQAGGRYVCYTYTISLLIVTLTRSSKVKYISPGKNRILPGLPYALISLLTGWWGIPFGFVLTPIALVKTLAGGNDVTGEVVGVDLLHQYKIPESKNTLALIIASIGVLGCMAGGIYWLVNTSNLL